MAWIRSAWNNFKVQPEIWFFYCFLATSMLSVRKVVSDIFMAGQFNEYAGTYLYLSDIFLFLTIVVWVISILYNKISTLSISRVPASSGLPKCSTPVRMFHGEHPAGQAWNFLRGRRGTKVILLGLPVLLVIWSFITINWSGQPQIALYRSFKLFEFYLLFLFLARNPKCSIPASTRGERSSTRGGSSILRNAFRIIIAVSVINAIIGISQVILQHSLGLFWLKESLISPDLPGVAKIILGGAKYIRAYGLFPHPNILGGFLFLSILMTLAYRQLFHPDTNVPHGTSYGAGVEHPTGQVWNILRGKSEIPWLCLLGIQIVAGILTFSKSAILGLILALAYMFHACPVNSKCSTGNILNFYGVEYFEFLRGGILKKALFLGIIILLLVFIINPDLGSIFTKSLSERLVYINISLNIISGNFLAGIGSGQFVLEMQKYSSQLLLDWQFQPVHNVFLLIWSELGLVGFSLFAWFIWKMFHRATIVSPRKECSTGNILRGKHGTFGAGLDMQVLFKALLIGFFAIALFDHYLWDIQQGQLMLWLVLGFLARTRLENNLTE